ncbi:exported hypothetical protein [Candidatus Sulfotelmatobacter sp. SbA7]|nr:exported hypothetical protein [Candidatus Sulfotelmatobacter sp. SbA7]
MKLLRISVTSSDRLGMYGSSASFVSVALSLQLIITASIAAAHIAAKAVFIDAPPAYAFVRRRCAQNSYYGLRVVALSDSVACRLKSWRL